MIGTILTLALLGQTPAPQLSQATTTWRAQTCPNCPTATYQSTLTITQTPATPATVTPRKPKTIYGVVPGAPTSGYSFSETTTTPTSVQSRSEAIGPAPLVRMKKGWFGRYRMVK